MAEREESKSDSTETRDLAVTEQLPKREEIFGCTATQNTENKDNYSKKRSAISVTSKTKADREKASFAGRRGENPWHNFQSLGKFTQNKMVLAVKEQANLPKELKSLFETSLRDSNLWHVTRNNMANALIHQANPNPELFKTFMAAIDDDSEGPEWRDFSVQHLAATYDFASDQQAVIDKLQEVSQNYAESRSSTALLHLHRLELGNAGLFDIAQNNRDNLSNHSAVNGDPLTESREEDSQRGVHSQNSSSKPSSGLALAPHRVTPRLEQTTTDPTDRAGDKEVDLANRHKGDDLGTRPKIRNGKSIIHAEIPANIDETITATLNSEDSHILNKITAIGLIGERKLIHESDRLRQIISTSAEPSLIRTAIAALGKIGNPDDIQLIQQHSQQSSDPLLTNISERALKILSQ